MYDDTGRLLYSEPEPEFDQFDREHFEALFNLRADTCSCGGLLSETTGEPHGYDINHITCWRCHSLATRQDELAVSVEKNKAKDKYGNPIIPSAEKWTAVRIPPKP